MASIFFNSFLAILLAVPVVSLIAAGVPLLRRLPSALLVMGSLAGAAAGAMSLCHPCGVAGDYSWITPFPFVLSLDRLSGFFLLLVGMAGAPVALYSSAYVERHYAGARKTWLWALLPLFLLSMVIVVTASTVFAFLFGWELMTLFSAGLILVEGDDLPRRQKLFTYLLMMHAGAAAVVGAFFLFLPHAAGLDFASLRLAGAMMPAGVRNAAFVLAFIGFGAKAGIIPLHVWLPKAHPIAPSPVSALMSGVMLKTAVYGFVRFGFDFLGTGPAWWGYLVLAAGAISGVLGVLYALAEQDIKRLLAYSSVENIGVIFLGLGAALVLLSYHAPGWAAVALMGALLHSLNHALLKSLLFLGAGAVADATHTLDIEELGGLFGRMRTTGTLLLIACCSLAGLPLFNGFVGEWLTFRSFLGGATLTNVTPGIVLPLMAGVLALIGGLAAACFANLYGAAFLGRPRSVEAGDATEVPLAMYAGMALLAAASLLIGIAPGIILRPLSVAVMERIPGAILPEGIWAIPNLLPWLALAVAAIVGTVLAVRRVPRITPTWACGMPGLNSRMQYTFTAFSHPLRKVFKQAYRPERQLSMEPAGQPYFPVAIWYQSVRTVLFEQALYRPAVNGIVAAANRLRKLQTGNIQVYLLYMFLALVLLLLFMRLA